MMDRYHIGFFPDEKSLLEAAREAKNLRFEIEDVYTPYPVHGLDEIMGLRPSRLAVVGFIAGVVGLIFALTLQIWTSAVDWPLNVGGKPFNSFPVFIPVAFELTVLFSGFIALGGLVIRTRLWPFSRRPVLPGVTDDLFALVLAERDAGFDLHEAHELMLRAGAVDITEGIDLV